MGSNIVYYQRSERIIDAGKQDRAMYIILEGEVEITLANSTERFVVAVLKKNDFFGEISLFTSKPRSATATALGNVKLLKVDNEEQLKALLMKNPGFAAKMVHMLAQRLAKTDEILIGKISEINRLKQTRNI